MNVIDRTVRIAQAFSLGAESYDDAASLQWLVARQLAERIESAIAAPHQRILEVGCGTGFLSSRLAHAFPASDLLLTDIAPSMLSRCRSRLGHRHRYQVLDGERPEQLAGPYDLIASSLAFQWFTDLRGGLQRLSGLLAPGGRLLFATLGCQSFIEWRQAHTDLGFACGTHDYPSAEELPWPQGFSHRVDAEMMAQHHPNALDFVRRLKALGAHAPAPGYHPLPLGAFRRLLASLEDGFSVTYHLLYGEICRASTPEGDCLR
jgi:malonyl-CoA O-methyltransferase